MAVLDRILDYLPGRRPQDLRPHELNGRVVGRMGPDMLARLDGGEAYGGDDIDDHYFHNLLREAPMYGARHDRLVRLVGPNQWGEPPAPAPAPKPPSFDHVWTHGKERPRPGFTFDFETTPASANAPIVVDDEPSQIASSSSSRSPPKTSTFLVCPRCQSTLHMGAKTVYGLRCGHMICVSCMDDISLPLVKPEPAEEPIFDVKGKGKAKEEPEEPIDVTSSPVRRNPRRGKPPRDPEPKTPRAATAKESGSKKRRRGPVMKEGQVLEEHEYACPVGDCLRPHWSVRVWSNHAKAPDGSKTSGSVWKPKDNAGAIPIFT